MQGRSLYRKNMFEFGSQNGYGITNLGNMQSYALANAVFVRDSKDNFFTLLTLNYDTS